MSKGISGWEKCTLLTKPEQSGKTFLMLQKIVEDFSEEPREDGKQNINFILCDNNLLLVLQTSDRVNSDEELRQFRNIETGEIYIEFSSSKRTKTNTSDTVFRFITTGKISNIICCSNSIRCEDIFKIIIDISNAGLKDKFHFNIWFDEADKFIKLINEYIIPTLEKYENISLYPISATPERIIRYFKEINIWAIENPTLENYHGWNDNEIIPYDNTICKKNDFVEHILSNNSKEIKSNTRWFIPASNSKSSHHKIKDICREYGIVTMIINGDGITVYMLDGRIIENDKDDMPDKLIPKIYSKYELYKFPFAITGYLCISRGITISSQDFMLTHAIMPLSISNKSELSQIAGRMKGNQKLWKNYIKPKIFCSDKFNKLAKEIENKTIQLAKIAFESEWKTVTLEKFKTVEKEWFYYSCPTPFDTYRKALEYLSGDDIDKDIKPLSKTKKEINVDKMDKKRPIHKTINGYYLTSKRFKKEDIEQNIIIERQRFTYESYKDFSEGFCISEPENKRASYLIYPVYESFETIPQDVKYYVRHTKRR